jgi:type I restriction enzyme S subunit
MSQGVDLCVTKERISEDAVRECGGRLVPPGTLVMSFKLSVGKLGFVRTAMFTNEAIAALPLRERKRIDLRFLFRALQAARLTDDADRAVKGLTLNSEKLARIPIRYPDDIAEQRRIADILDKADAIRRKRKETFLLTENLLRSIFFDMFGDPVTNSKGWKVAPLGEVIERLEAGWSANGEARRRRESEYGVLKVSAVTSGVFRPDEHKAVASDAVDRELVTPARGDLLFSRANTRELVAATCLVREDHSRLFLPDKIWRVTPRAEIATTPYLRFLLSHEQFRRELTKAATGTSGSMLNVSMEKLRALRAPMPPFSAQRRFGEVVWSALDASRLYEASRSATDELFDLLVQRAFSGKLGRTEGAC